MIRFGLWKYLCSCNNENGLREPNNTSEETGQVAQEKIGMSGYEMKPQDGEDGEADKFTEMEVEHCLL